MHLHHATDALALIFDRVINLISGPKYAGVNAKKCQSADKGICSNFECQGRKRRVIVGFAGSGIAIFDCSFNSLYFGRCGQVIHHRI